MSHAVPVSDEIYRIIEALAHVRGMTPEALTETLLREHLAERAALARQNAEWDDGLDAALARAARGENPQYDSMKAFFATLDEQDKERLEE